MLIAVQRFKSKKGCFEPIVKFEPIFCEKSEPILQNEPIRILYPFHSPFTRAVLDKRTAFLYVWGGWGSENGSFWTIFRFYGVIYIDIFTVYSIISLKTFTILFPEGWILGGE